MLEVTVDFDIIDSATKSSISDIITADQEAQSLLGEMWQLRRADMDPTLLVPLLDELLTRIFGKI